MLLYCKRTHILKYINDLKEFNAKKCLKSLKQVKVAHS